MSARPAFAPHEGVILYCTGRGTHEAVILGAHGLPDDPPWVPARRVTPAHEYRCRECGRSWRLGVRRFRALAQAAGSGALSGEIDLSAVA